MYMANSLLVYYLVFYLYLHACTARLLIMVSDKHIAADQLQDVEIDHNASENHNFFSVQNSEGKTTKGSHSWKILHHGSEAKIRKRSQRSMVESKGDASSKDNGPVEEIVVMDYAQPHRKPPIHNKGT